MTKLAWASLAPIYAGAVGFLYLWGYWRRFDINFLEFASIGDLVRLPMLPLVTTLFVFPILYGVVQLIDPMHKWQSLRLTKHAKAESRPPKLWKVIVALIATAIIVSFLYWWTILEDNSSALVALGPVTGFWLAMRLIEDEVRLVPTIPHSAESLLILVCTALPFLAYGYGATQSRAIDDPNQHFRDVTRNTGEVPVSGYRYLGTLGDFAVFRTQQRTVLVTKWDEVGALELPRRAPTAGQQSED